MHSMTSYGEPMKLDLGCGQRKQAGFHGVDVAAIPGVDTVMDLFTTPWPFDSDTIEEVHCSHFFEHVPAKRRFAWMNELHRIMKPGAKAVIIVPYWASQRSVQDPTHEWPPICENSFLYFNKKWREDNLLTHGPYAECVADFDFSYGFSMPTEWVIRNDEAKGFAMRHYNNAVDDLHVTMLKRLIS